MQSVYKQRHVNALRAGVGVNGILPDTSEGQLPLDQSCMECE
jgi:hypothetical protein